MCGHSSRRSVTARAHQRPTRRFRQRFEPPCRIGPMRDAALALGRRLPPYLVLLRVGFTLPPPLLAERCALTAPFHPYPGAAPAANPIEADRFGDARLKDGVAEAVCSLWHWPSTGLDARVPDVIRHTALRSSDFPPPDTLACARASGSDRPVLLPPLVYRESSHRNGRVNRAGPICHHCVRAVRPRRPHPFTERSRYGAPKGANS